MGKRVILLVVHDTVSVTVLSNYSASYLISCNSPSEVGTSFCRSRDQHIKRVNNLLQTTISRWRS